MKFETFCIEKLLTRSHRFSCLVFDGWNVENLFCLYSGINASIFPSDSGLFSHAADLGRLALAKRLTLYHCYFLLYRASWAKSQPTSKCYVRMQCAILFILSRDIFSSGDMLVYTNVDVLHLCIVLPHLH